MINPRGVQELALHQLDDVVLLTVVCTTQSLHIGCSNKGTGLVLFCSYPVPCAVQQTKPVEYGGRLPVGSFIRRPDVPLPAISPESHEMMMPESRGSIRLVLAGDDGSRRESA